MLHSQVTFLKSNAMVLTRAHYAQFSEDEKYVHVMRYGQDPFPEPYRLRTYDAESYAEVRDYCIKNDIRIWDDVKNPISSELDDNGADVAEVQF